MRNLVIALVVLLVFAAAADAGWQYAGSFPDSSAKWRLQAHGLAVDPSGRIWIPWWNPIPGDSILDQTDGRYYSCRGIYVFNPDGSQAPFSPIRVIVTGSQRDTLWAAPSARSVTSRGIRTDHQGNILFTSFDRVHKINYQTGAGISRVIPVTNASGVSVGVDTLGEWFYATVVPGNPIKIYDSGFNFLGNVTDTSIGFSRSFEVSKDGNYVYWAGYTLHAIYRYFSPNGSFGPYVLQDTVAKGMDIESFGWNPSRTRLWISSGSTNDRPNRFPGATTNFDVNTWYAWNPATDQVTDSINWNFQFSVDSANIRPRAIAFSPDGLTAYVGCFGQTTYPPVQKFTFTSDVQQTSDEIPASFTLEQNYPNPFNPETEIRFNLTKAGMTTLKVYDMLGREVETLASQDLTAGTYSVKFFGSRHSSGTYVYILSQNGQNISKKMLLVK